MSESAIIEAMQQATEEALSQVNTTVPGVIVSYDAARNRAVVKPSLPKRLADGTELEAPNIHEVPVLWTNGGGGTFTFPIRPGDGVMLQFQQRSLEGWLGGNTAAPDDPRQFDMSDAIALPGLRHDHPAVDAEAVVLNLGDTALRIEPEGIVRIKATKLIVEADIQVEGRVDVTEDVKAADISLREHVHLGRAGTERISVAKP